MVIKIYIIITSTNSVSGSNFDDYFSNSYKEGERYSIPNSGFSNGPQPWIEWMKKAGKELKLSKDLTRGMDKEDTDLRLIRELEPEGDYLFKVYLQYELEKMMNGMRSVRILRPEDRSYEDEQYKTKFIELAEEFSESIKDRLERIGLEEKITKKAPRSPEIQNLNLSEMKKIVEIHLRNNSGPAIYRNFYGIIAVRCVKLLFQESRTKVGEKKLPGEKERDEERGYAAQCPKCKRFFKKLNSHSPSCAGVVEKRKFVKISLRENKFYVGLSEFLNHLLNEACATVENLKTTDLMSKLISGDTLSTDDLIAHPSEVEDAKDVLTRLGEEKYRKPTLERAARILSLAVLSILSAEGWVWRKSGKFEDFELHYDGDEHTKKKIGLYNNMLIFSEKLKSEIGNCDPSIHNQEGALIELKNREHPIFRVLDRHPIRWMNCCPEDHLDVKYSSPQGNFLHEGGYLIPRPESSLRQTIASHRKYERMGIPRTEYNNSTIESLNILQKTQWEINLDFLEEIALYTDVNGRKRSDFKQKKIWIDYITIRPEVERAFYFKNDITANNERQKRLAHIKKIIDNDANLFWHAWSLDWRGRMVAKAPLLSPQQSDLDRALIRFKEWKPIQKTGWERFKIFLFDFFVGLEDKRFTETPLKSFDNDERKNWVGKNEEILKEIAQKWKEDKNLKLLELDEPPKSKSVIFQRFSALIEFKRLLQQYDKTGEDWSQVKSGHPVHVDASSNGLQHLSLLLDNKDLAKKVNVLENDGKKQDIYLEVSEKGKEYWNAGNSKLKKYLEKSLGPKKLDRIRDEVFTRNMAKQPTMTIFYGARRLDRCFLGKNGKGKPKYMCSSCWKIGCKHMIKNIHIF